MTGRSSLLALCRVTSMGLCLSSNGHARGLRNRHRNRPALRTSLRRRAQIVAAATAAALQQPLTPPAETDEPNRRKHAKERDDEPVRTPHGLVHVIVGPPLVRMQMA